MSRFGSNSASVILSKTFNVGLLSDMYGTISFKLCMIIETLISTFYTSLGDLDLHARSHLYEEAKASALIFF